MPQTNKKIYFNKNTLNLARYHKALSHPARIAILEKLAKRSTCICGEIVNDLPLAQSTVSQHLKELKSAGLIQGKIDGLKSCYCLDPKGIKQLLRIAKDLSDLLRAGAIKRRTCK